MESTDSNATQKSNDPYEEDQGDTNEAGDHDLWPEWPDGGMVCPVTGCGTKFYVNLTTYWGHWKIKHLKQLRQLYCPKCSHKSLNKRYFATHLTKKHKIKLSDLDQIIASAHTELIPNKEFIPPGTQRCPKRKSLNSESQMAPKRRRMKSPSQDSQCKHDEDNSSMTVAGSVEFPKGKVHDLSVSERRTKRPRLSAAQVLEIKQGSGGEKKSTKQTDFNEPAVASNLGSDLGIQSDNKKYVDDFGFEDKRILQVGLKVDMAPAISKEDNVSDDIVKQVVAVLEREETEINESVTVVTESSVEIKRKDPDVDIATVESDKAIDTQVLECVSKLMEGVVEMKRKVTIESEKIIDTQVSESFTNVTESAVQIKRKFAIVDKGTIEMEKPIDTQVLECIPKVTESGVQIADVDKGIIEMKKPIDTQVLECIPKVTESVVQIVDVDKGTIEMDKDAQVSVRVGTSDIQRNVDSKKVSEAARKIETVTDSASIFHDIPSDRIRKEADKSITEIPESSCIRIRQREDEEKIYPSVATETVNDKERHGIYISYDTVITKGDDKSEYNDNDQSEYNDKDQSECVIKDQSEYNDNDQKECEIKGQSECDIKDQSEYNDKDQSECDIKDQSEYNDNDQKECDIKDRSEYNDKDQSECDIKDQSEYNEKDQSECDIKDQSECDIKDQSDHNESDQDLTVTDDSELDEAKEAEDLDTVVRPIFLDGQMLCPGSGCFDLDQIYDSLKAFYKHWQDEHQSSVQRFECPSCSFKDVRKLEIRRHLKTEHNVRHRGVLEELMSLVKLESTLKTAEDSKSETSSKRKSTSQLKTKIKKQKIPLESDADETKAGKDTKDESPKDEDAIRAEIQCVGESSEKLSPKKEKVVWFFGMSCPVKNCCTRKFVSPREFHNHWENVHNPYIKKFECPICQYQNTQREVVGNHLRLFHNAVKTNDVRDLSQIKMVDVGNPMYKDPGMFYFGNVSSMPVENQDVKATTTMSPVQVTSSNTSEALVESTEKSPSKNEQRGLESLSSKSGAREKEPIKVVFVSNMLCPVDNCGFHIFTTLAAFASHWKKIHLPHRDLFECRLCKFRSSRKQSVYVHIKNVHGMRYHTVGQNIYKVLDINVLFHDPFPFYFEKSLFDEFELTNVSDSTSGSKSASGLQKKEDKGTDGIHELKKAEDTGTQANEESEKISKDSIPVHWVLGMSCPVMNCGASYFMTFLSFQSHWENIHNINILKFKCPKCTYTNITKANVIAHLSVQHKMSDAMIKAKTNQIQNVKVKNNRYIDPGFYSFSVMEQFQNDQTNTSPSEKKEMDLGGDLKGKIEKTRKVTWMEGMSCPVKACASETYLTLDSFSNHWIKTHHLELNMFQCSQCAFKAIQKSEIENHLKSHHWILAEKDVTTALTKVNVVKVLNPAFKDTEGYYFETAVVPEEEGECSLSKSENKSSEQASNEMDLGGDLKGKIEKTIKVTWIEGMSCPVKACGSETYLTHESFSNHWIKTHHLELNMFQCSLCTFKTAQKSDILNHLKSHHWILAEKDEMTALTKVNVVKVLNPAFKDAEGYYLESPGTEEEADSSLTEMDFGGDLKGKIEKTRKVTWIEGMCCPVKACGSETYLTLDSFSNHWIKTHHLEFNMFQCSQCVFKAIQKSEIENHLKSHHWILAEKDVMTALTKVNVVKVLNPAFKDTEGYYFETAVVPEEEGECSLSKSENKSSEQASNVTIGTCEASVKSMKNSPSENEEVSLKSVTSNSAAGNKEPIKVVFVSNMRCPVDKCCTRGFRKLSNFKNHWKARHLPFQEDYICKICNSRKTAENCKSWRLKDIYWHIENVHRIKHPTIEKNIIIEHNTNFHFVDPGLLYFKKVARSTDGSQSASSIQKKEEKESKSMSEEGMPKIVVEWKYNMTCPIHKCDLEIFDSWTTYCKHWKMVHEQRYLKTHACPKCSFQSGEKSHLVNHMKQCHSLVGRELERAAEEIKFVDVENPSFIDPGNYTLNWFGKSNDNKKSSTTASSEISKSEATLQKKDTEPTEKEEMYHKKFIFAPGMPCPVKNCSSVQISSYSAFVHHWNEQHDLMLKKFACTMCNFKHIQKSIVFMHVGKEHGMPSHVITEKITTVMETNVKAEELFVPDLPTDPRGSIVMVKPDDSEATLQKKDTEPTEKEEMYHKKFIFAPGMPCPVKNCSSVQISSYSAFVHHWNEQHDLMLKKFACTMCNFTHIQKSIVFMHVRNEHGMPSYVIPKKIKTVNSPKVKAEELFVPDLPTDHRRSIVMVNPDDSGQINTYDTNGGKIKEATDVVEEIKKSDENIRKLNEQKDESRDESDKDESKGQKHEDTCTGLRDEKKPLESTQPADVDRENVFINNPTQMVYKSSDNDTKLRMSASENQEEKETGAFEEVLPDSSAEQPTLTVTVQTEVKQLVFPKDTEDMIDKEKLYVKGKDESTKEAVKIVMPSGSSDVPKIVVDDEDVISDFEEDSVTVDMSEFICLDEIGEEDAEASEMSPEKQIAKETELPGDQDYEIQDEVSPPTEDDQMEDILKYFICIDDIGGDKDDIGDDKDDIGDENDDIGNEKDNIGNEKDDIGNEKDNIGDEERS